MSKKVGTGTDKNSYSSATMLDLAANDTLLLDELSRVHKCFYCPLARTLERFRRRKSWRNPSSTSGRLWSMIKWARSPTCLPGNINGQENNNVEDNLKQYYASITCEGEGEESHY
jgi:hypothetical protein